MRKCRFNLQRLICKSPFPLSFLLRNFRVLRQETSWKGLPHRLRRALLLDVVYGRWHFFLEIMRWKHEKNHGKVGNFGSTGSLSASTGIQEYCNHCGACCEFASGMPDFHSTEGIPAHWQKVFGEGLGRGHRFCPFLWENRASHGSLCSIHLWRPAPCRSFEAEECEYLKEEPGFTEPTFDRNLSMARRWLIHLIDSRKPPGRRPNIPAKRPKFLKFHRI